jgi:DNA polymerase III epsilon subunit family exonuclease
MDGLTLGLLVLLLVAFIVNRLFASSGKSSDRTGAPRKYGSGSRIKSEGKPAKVSPENGFVVFDVETTGLNASRNKIIEIAAIKVSSLERTNHQTLDYLIRIKSKLPAKTIELTGITDEMLKNDGVGIDQAIAEFRAFCGDLPLVAYNAEFDKGFLSKAALDHEWTVENEFHCALLMAREAFPGHTNYKLSTLAGHAGIDTSNAHRALSDCVMAAQVYAAAYKKLGRAISV